MTARAIETDVTAPDAELITLPVSAGQDAAATVAAAQAEAEQITASARRDAFLLYTSARQDAERVLDEARAEAEQIVVAARVEADQLAAASRAAVEEAAAKLLGEAVREQAVAAAEAPPAPVEEIEVPLATGRRTRSRYSVRSAKLPHLGDDAGRAALAAVQNLRGALND